MANEIAVFIARHAFDVKNTMPFSNIYLIATFLLLGLFYYTTLKGLYIRKVLWLIVLVFEVYFLINLIFLQNIFEYPVFARSIGTIVIVSFSIAFFYKTMIEAKIKNLWNEPLIWINSSILIWYSGNLFFTILFNLILEYSRAFSKITMFYFSFLYLIFYGLIAVGFLKAKKNKSLSPY